MKFLRSYWGLLIVIIVSLLPLIPLLHPGLPLTHDGQDHVARIANFYQSLSEGNLIPRWAGNLNWGYGHPILMFLYPASSYSASLFHLIGFPIVESVKIVFGLSFVLSGVFMYLWIREFLGDQAAVVGAVLYNFAPYRFVDLYVRGAIGEHVAFVFVPLVLFFLLKIAKEKRFNRFYFCFAALSLAGLILAHNAISIIFLPFIFVYAIYLVYINRTQARELVIQDIGVLILGLSSSAFFLVPAFVEGKYTLRDIVTGGEALTRFVEFKDILYSVWNFGISGYFSVQLGLFQWIGVIAFPLVLYILKKRKDKGWILYSLVFLYFLGSIFIMLPQSEFIWRIVTTLQKFQFPWRFLSVSVFTSALLGAYLIYIMPNKMNRIAMVFVLILTLLITYNFWQPKGYLIKPDTFYTGIYNGTTDTGESAPIWSVRFMEKSASASAEVIQGSGTIKEVFRNSTYHKYKTTSVYKIRFRENTLYFPGWRVYIDGKLYQGVQFQEPANRGIMTFYVLGGTHTIEIKFGDTRLRTLSNYVSLAALLIILGIVLNTFGIFSRKITRNE